MNRLRQEIIEELKLQTLRQIVRIFSLDLCLQGHIDDLKCSLLIYTPLETSVPNVSTIQQEMEEEFTLRAIMEIPNGQRNTAFKPTCIVYETTFVENILP